MPENTLARTPDDHYQQLLALIEAQGPYRIYQAWDRLNIDGQRPTEPRFRIYGLDELIDEATTVLDLGCNVGFMALRCAQAAREVWGVERYAYWLEIARLAQECLGIHNAHWFCGDALAFEPTYEFDLMLSLSFHHWGPEVFAKYVETVYKGMLKQGGHLLFESHKLDPHGGPSKDPFIDYVDYLTDHGFEPRRSGVCQCPTNYPRPNPFRRWFLLELVAK